MGGTSIAAPSAAVWATDFLNAAYYARAPDERNVDDLRLAFSILTTRWDRKGRRRLRITDLPAFHKAFGRLRARRDGGVGRLTRDDILHGAVHLFGPWFPSGYDDPRRRGWGIVFETAEARGAYRPEDRMRNARLGPLTPPSAPPAERIWKTYRPVPVADLDLTLGRLMTPETWPDFGSDHGRFTPLRAGGLPGQTFEIELVAGAATRHPLLTRAYVTATRVEGPDRPDSLQRLIDEMDAGLATTETRALPDGHEAVAAAQLTTHDGHPIGPAISHFVLSTGPGGAQLRDVGVWDPMKFPLGTAYRHGGHEAQAAFWGEAQTYNSMLHQFAHAAGD
jgi:hypothetical protein